MIRKIVFSDVVCHGRYGEKPCVKTQIDTVKDTIVTGYTKELKITLQYCLKLLSNISLIRRPITEGIQHGVLTQPLRNIQDNPKEGQPLG